jgi:ankyrin repeat protein
LGKYNALHEAAIWGNIPLMQLLIEVGKVDVNHPDVAGNTALHLISPQKMNVAHAKFLLQNGASPNAKNNVSATPLHAVGSVEMAEVLVEGGADLGVENSAKYSPPSYPSQLLISRSDLLL